MDRPLSEGFRINVAAAPSVTTLHFVSTGPHAAHRPHQEIEVDLWADAVEGDAEVALDLDSRIWVVKIPAGDKRTVRCMLPLGKALKASALQGDVLALGQVN